MKYVRWSLIAVGVVIVFVVFARFYTSFMLERATAKGVYASPEAGMQALANQYYAPDRQVKIVYAGTNSFNGSEPYIWYVIAEVRASAHADGTPVGADGCEAPGSFFLQTRDGWVHVTEAAMPRFIGYWMNVFGWAGPGNPTASINWTPEQEPRFCQE